MKSSSSPVSESITECIINAFVSKTITSPSSKALKYIFSIPLIIF